MEGDLGALIVYLGPRLAFQAEPLDREYPIFFPPNCDELNFAITLRPAVWESWGALSVGTSVVVGPAVEGALGEGTTGGTHALDHPVGCRVCEGKRDGEDPTCLVRMDRDLPVVWDRAEESGESGSAL